MKSKVNDYETPTIQIISMINTDVITASGDYAGPDVDLGDQG